MIGMEQIDQDLADLKAEGETVLEIRMSPTRHRHFRDEGMASAPIIAAELAEVEHHRGTPIVVVEDMADDAIMYGLQG